MNKIVTTALAAALLAAGTPVAHALTPALVLGGTGQSATVPAAQNILDAFADPIVDDDFVASQVLYNAGPLDRPQAATGTLDAAIRAQIATSSDGRLTVIGLSKGAQVVHSVIIAYNADPTAPDPSKVRFATVGDPDGDHGLTRVFGLSAPHETRYDVDHYVAQYDFFADVPDWWTNPFTTANWAMGFFTHTTYGQGGDWDPLNHLDEAQVTRVKNLDASGNWNGTYTTTHLIPTNRYLPLTLPLRIIERTLTGQNLITDTVDLVVRPLVDAGYYRAPIKPSSPITTDARVADIPRVDATLASVAQEPETERVETEVESEPVKTEPKPDPVHELADRVRAVIKSGNKFSPGDTVVDKKEETDHGTLTATDPDESDTNESDAPDPATVGSEDTTTDTESTDSTDTESEAAA